jgi:sulfide dehydrogenase cytochrome subunit
MSTPKDSFTRIQKWGAVGCLTVATALGLAACGGGSSSEVSAAAESSAAAAADETKVIERSRTTSPTPSAVAQPANTEGRLLASNCFQCHGTLGTGGFDSIRGGEASEVLEYMTKTANRDIMAAHAQGYTRAQLLSIITYLQQ